MKALSNLKALGLLSCIALLALTACTEAPVESEQKPVAQRSASDHGGTLSSMVTPKDPLKNRLNFTWTKIVKERAEALRTATSDHGPGDKISLNVVAFVDASGRVRGVRVAKSSGIPELDRAAVDSFKQASPLTLPRSTKLRKGIAEIPWTFNLVR